MSIDAHVVILAGGSGLRLWPFSRALLPKQLQSFEGEVTLLQQAAQRALTLFEPERTWVITTEEQVFEVRSQLRALRHELDAQVVAEPVGRGTLPATLVGLDRVLTRDPDAVVVVSPSDHLVHRPGAWRQALLQGIDLARQGWFVTFGVVPHRPDPDYGYLELGQPLGDECFEVGRFVEKPDPDAARAWSLDGRHLWNSGLFVFSARTLVQALGEHQPALAAWWEARSRAPLLQDFGQLPSLSLDRGIMEKVQQLAVIRTDFGWDDLGNWEAIHALGHKSPQGNVVQGDVLELDCHDSLLVSAGGGALAAVGLRDLVVVQTRDATLVCPRDRVQQVRDVVRALEAQHSQLVEAHVTVRRPWGSYTVLEQGPSYKLKRIEVHPGAALSLQKHLRRSEHWVVVSGTAEVRVDDRVFTLHENQSVDVPRGSLHRLRNPSAEPVQIIEIQSGDYVEEDDIVRYEDDYGRGT